jgi:hypothetical protein
MSDHQFPSGQWVGYYTYAGRTRKYFMDLVLEFKNERMTGEGTDGIGVFVISGNYSQASGECGWLKEYVGRHAVEYKGYREGKGIWGNWQIGLGKGGFQIWPLSEGPGIKLVEESETEEKSVPVSGTHLGFVSDPGLDGPGAN